MDREQFLNRKQKDDESLELFWHALNGLAVNCDFGTHTTGLEYNIFVSNMKNTLVQERLFTEPEDNPEGRWNLRLLLSKGPNRRKRKQFASKAKYQRRAGIRSRKNNECYKCGDKPFTRGHQKICKAKTLSAETAERLDTMPAYAEWDSQKHGRTNQTPERR